ncbi:FAD-dependent monooxygenase [Amycolatopsis rhabdoformis]|uniref:FAD-dependent monooxygenase n=1 Tax=Amycolatopsis rhabdoformis TaxID=1448059 RepID=A0ABZ1IK16_9PSEU|nr:FAD-dependent monooxygenase [Amycolatopsis rhabdoformis]WSE34627.1 FAD-dependent monooxygenase [Amycolatopsis rhabdoformis]
MTGSGQDTVLVVGAGPVGLTLAAELVRQGARVRVVEELTEPTTQSRAVVVHPRTQEHLAAMGVLDGMVREAAAVTALEIYAGHNPRQPDRRQATGETRQATGQSGGQPAVPQRTTEPAATSPSTPQQTAPPTGGQPAAPQPTAGQAPPRTTPQQTAVPPAAGRAAAPQTAPHRPAVPPTVGQPTAHQPPQHQPTQPQPVVRQPTVRLDTGRLATRYPRILDLPQPRTEALLAERVAELGVQVERGVALESLKQDSGGVTATFTSAAGRERSRYAWVVGADGGHSTTRTAVGTRIEGVFEGQHFLFADVAATTEFAPDAVRMFAHPAGIGGAFPMPGGRTRLLFQVEPPPPGAVPTIAETQALVDERAGGAWRVTDAHWLTYFEIHHGQVPRYRHGRVLLAGDAAHIHSPAGGQGMNTGIHDAVNLAWKLALVSTGRADPVLLDSYHAERHPVGASVVKQTTRMTDTATDRGLRTLALFLAGHLPPMRDELISGISEVDIHYRHSPIVTGHAGSRRHPRPGDHAPDLPGLRTADGTPTCLDELLRRPGHLLLTAVQDEAVLDRFRAALAGLGTVVPVSRTAATGLHDPEDSFATHYGTGDHGLALIRPDGYLGLITREATPAAVASYVQRLLHG